MQQFAASQPLFLYTDGMNEQLPHIAVLNELITEFRMSAPSKSLREFSQFLDVNSGTLTQILSGKRRLPIKLFNKINDKFELNTYQLIQLSQGMSSASLKKVKAKKLVAADSDQAYLENTVFKILSEWHHFAILSLMQTVDFQGDFKWIAERLSLTEESVSTAMNNLKTANLIKENSNGQWMRTNLSLETSEALYNRGNNKGHIAELLIALDKVKDSDGDVDNFSSMTIPIDLDYLEDLHELTEKYQNQVEALSRKGSPKEVYTINVQFYPISQAID